MDRPARPSSRRPRPVRLLALEALERRTVPSAAPWVAPPPDDAILPAALPQDPSFASQWALQNIGQTGGVIGVDVNATRAWDVTTGSRSVVVAVIDSGIDLTHPDLAANLWRNPREIAGNGLDDDGNGFVDDIHGWNFVEGNASVQDGFGHGTHVAGIIGAVGNDGRGVAGLNWQVSIMVLRVQDDAGVGSTAAVIGALQYATRMRRDFGVNVVVTNNSWEAAAGYSGVVEEVISQQAEAGITFVAAAGNRGTDSDLLPRYPGSYDLPNVIAVASLTAGGELAGSSCYGAKSVDLAAPGTLILSTWKGGGWVALSGTSMAAPHVSGTVALLAAAKPGITVAEVRTAILGTTAPLAALAGKTVTGGRLDAFAALASVRGTTATVMAAPPLVYAERFDRAGPLSAPWVTRLGGFTNSGGVAVSGAGVSVATLGGVSKADSIQRAFVDLRAGFAVGLVARYSGPGDQSMYLAQFARVSGGYVVQIFRHFGGRWALLSVGRVTEATGWLRFDVTGSRLVARFNGKIVASAIDGLITAAGSVGLRACGSGTRTDSYAVW